MQKDIRKIRIVLAAAILTSLAGAASLSAQTLSNTGFTTVQKILDRSCSGCHDWTASYDTVIADGRVTAGQPDKSDIWVKVSDDTMPQSGDKLTTEEKDSIKGWILAGAPSTDQPLAQASAAPSPAAATPSPAVTPRPAPSPAAVKIAFHEVSGFTSAALFTAAGVLGVVHFAEMKNVIHPGGVAEDAGSIEGAGGDSEAASGPIISIWNSQQALRWWHVGLVSAGETLYLGDAITGLSMLSKPTPGKLTRSDVHRYAFFTHVTLMAAQIALGFLETDALSRGAHDEMLGYTAAHAVVGLAIPAVMLFAGLENILP